MSSVAKKLLQVQPSAADDTGDDDFANVVLLLDGDGTSGDANNTFTDSSTNGFTITENGSVVQGSFSPYGDNWSVYFDGSAYLKLPSDATHAFGTGDYTIDCWIYPQNVSSASPFIFSLGPHTTANVLWMVYGTTYGGLTLGYTTGGAGGRILTNTQPIQDAWNHIGISRASGTTYIYLNGQQIASSTLHNGINLAQNGPEIGVETSTSTHYFKGYISNFRSIKGTALYTSSFTPPTEPLTAITNTSLLTCQSNRFIDNSSNGHTITVNGTPKVTPFSPFKDDDARDITTDGGSGYFDSSSDYLSISDNSAFDFGSGDFTIECWVNTSSFASAYNVLISQWNGSSQAWIFRITSSLVGLYANIGGTQTYTASVTNNLNEWNHFAVAREGSSLRFFKDGTLLGTSSISGTITNATSNVTVGILSDFNSTTAHDGYINDLRVVKGTAVYTSAFTPPTAPLTAVTNTELLLNFQDAGIYDRSGLNNLDTVGNAQIDTTVKKYGTGSIEFDGNSDYLLGAENQADTLVVSGAFTAECWFYQTATAGTGSGIHALISHWNNSTGNKAFVMGMSSTSMILSVSNDGTTNNISGATGGTVSNNTWNHAALTWDGTNYRVFLNGTAVITQANSSPPYASNEVIQIGTSKAGGSGQPSMFYQGYMDDVRITNGIARYTANFTPPTEALPKF